MMGLTSLVSLAIFVQKVWSSISESSSSSSSLVSIIGSSNQEEQEVEVSLAKRAEDALLGGIPSPVGVIGLEAADDQCDRGW